MMGDGGGGPHNSSSLNYMTSGGGNYTPNTFEAFGDSAGFTALHFAAYHGNP